MLDVCRTHIAINSEMEAMGLGGSKTVHAIQKGPTRKGPTRRQHKPQQQQPQQQHSAATVLCSTPQDVPPALAAVWCVEKLDTGSASVGRPRDDREPPDNANPSRMADPSPGRTGSMMLELTLTPTVMR